MLIFRQITIKNFLSFGNVPQSLKLDDPALTLILGENQDVVDSSSAASRNGTGKTSILQAICYALYGNSLAKIKKDNLCNKTNQKNMMVAIDFAKDGIEYRIERGRKPNFLKFLVNNQTLYAEDEAQGENKETQAKIVEILGISYPLFKQIIGLNTYQESILSQSAGDQRSLIEELLGISILTEKAKKLSDMIKSTKDSIKEEEYRLNAIKETNQKIQNSIKDLEIKSSAWEKTKQRNLDKLITEISELMEVDIEKEIDLHKRIMDYSAKVAESNRVQTEITRLTKNKKTKLDNIARYRSELESIKDSKCPTCLQDIHNEKGDTLKITIMEKIQREQHDLDSYEESLKGLIYAKVDPITEKPYYQIIQKAYGHKQTLEHTEMLLHKEGDSLNPYLEQIDMLKANAIQEYCMDNLDEMEKLKEHQDFLLKVLTNKDSFLRKKILQQNLGYLNLRLSTYLEKIGLPHNVIFMDNLEVDIQEHGRNLDFDNLSRGERTRLNLGLSWAFRDSFEMLVGPCNLQFLDEILDQGGDEAFFSAVIPVLKNMSRDHKKSIFLVSHREDLQQRIENIIMVIKSGGFSTIEIPGID